MEVRVVLCVREREGNRESDSTTTMVCKKKKRKGERERKSQSWNITTVRDSSGYLHVKDVFPSKRPTLTAALCVSSEALMVADGLRCTGKQVEGMYA